MSLRRPYCAVEQHNSYLRAQSLRARWVQFFQRHATQLAVKSMRQNLRVPCQDRV
jgi:hypothetical protein